MSKTQVDAEGGINAVTRTISIPAVLENYNFNHKRRGDCIIINNHHFNQKLTRQSDRDGTEVDAENVERAFMCLGFDVTRHDDLTVTDMSIAIREAAQKDHSEADCFVIVILSHGDEGVIYGTNGTTKIESLTYHFKGDVCPTLAGKPKLFFIQACRGRRYDFGTEQPGEDDVDAAISSNSVRKIPVEADFLFAYSVVPGHYSWRNNVDGSWFIQALCRVLHQHGDGLELMQLMTLVNKLVAYEFESCTDEDFTSGMKQVPCIVTTLTKLAYFKPKY